MSHVTPQGPRLAAVMADHDRSPEDFDVVLVNEGSIEDLSWLVQATYAEYQRGGYRA